MSTVVATNVVRQQLNTLNLNKSSHFTNIIVYNNLCDRIFPNAVPFQYQASKQVTMC
jgi:hypothetical protein